MVSLKPALLEQTDAAREVVSPVVVVAGCDVRVDLFAGALLRDQIEGRRIRAEVGLRRVVEPVTILQRGEEALAEDAVPLNLGVPPGLLLIVPRLPGDEFPRAAEEGLVVVLIKDDQ